VAAERNRPAAPRALAAAGLRVPERTDLSGLAVVAGGRLHVDRLGRGARLGRHDRDRDLEGRGLVVGLLGRRCGLGRLLRGHGRRLGRGLHERASEPDARGRRQDPRADRRHRLLRHDHHLHPPIRRRAADFRTRQAYANCCKLEVLEDGGGLRVSFQLQDMTMPRLRKLEPGHRMRSAAAACVEPRVSLVVLLPRGGPLGSCVARRAGEEPFVEAGLLVVAAFGRRASQRVGFLVVHRVTSAHAYDDEPQTSEPGSGPQIVLWVPYHWLEVTTMNQDIDTQVSDSLFGAALVQAVLAEPETTEPCPATARSAKPAEIQPATAYSKSEVTTMNQNSYPFRSKAQIAAALAESAPFRLECLGILFDRQTAYEQSSETTLNRNRQGFMSSHAVHGCRIAKKMRAGEELTAEDLDRVATIVPRYTRQLAEHFRHEAVAANPALKAAAAVFGV